MDGSRAADGRVLLRLEREALEAALFLPGGTAADKDKRMLPAGRTAIVFVWVTLQTGAIPTSLTHRFTLRIANPATSTPQTSATDETAVTISGVAVAVSPMSAPVIGPPLEGDLWLAANGPDNGVGHRRTLLALAGQGRIAQRFATDWVRLFDDGRTFRGDPSDNASYRAFGARVLAVAGGTVLETVMIWQLLQVSHLQGTPLILVGQMWPGLIEWARQAMLSQDPPLASVEDLSIPHCVASADEAIALLRDSHSAWLNRR